MMAKLMEREPDWGSFPPEMRRLIETIRRYGSDALSQAQCLLVSQIFRMAAMTAEPRVTFVRRKIEEAHIDYCFRLPTYPRK